MMYRVLVPPHVEKKIARFHPDVKQMIRAALDGLASNPYEGKPLKEALRGLYSYRVARYRIIYSIHDQILEVHVIALGHQKISIRKRSRGCLQSSPPL